MVQDITPGELLRERAPAGVWSRSNRLLTTGLVLTVVGAAFEALAVATILPATVRDLGGLSLYGWAFSAFMLTNLVGIAIAGAEADRQGPARPYVAGIVLFALGLLTAGLAPAMPVVILGRAIQGIGAGFISSVAYVAIGRGYADEARPRMLAVMSSAWIVPGLIGPALAGVIADSVGWRWVFLGLAPLMLVAATLALPALRRLSRAPSGPREWRQLASSAQLAAGAGLLLAGVGATSPYAIAPLVAVGALVGLPALRRLMPEGTLRAAAGLPATIATFGLLNMAFFGVDAFVPLALTAGRGQTATAAGIALTAATIAWSSASWVQAHLAQRGWRRALVIAGLALLALGVAGTTAVLVPWVPVWLAPLAWGIAGLGMGLAYSTISLLVLETAPAGQEGGATSAMQLANVLATAIGTGAGGAIVSATSVEGHASAPGLAAQNALMIGVVALAALAALRVPSRRPGAE